MAGEGAGVCRGRDERGWKWAHLQGRDPREEREDEVLHGTSGKWGDCIHIVYADLVSSVTLLDTSSHTQENK